jgi:hypothetical protein
LNLHVRRHWNLNPVRLPIPPHRHNHHGILVYLSSANDGSSVWELNPVSNSLVGVSLPIDYQRIGESDMMIPTRMKDPNISRPFKAQGRTRTDDLRFTKALLYPTELLRHSSKFKPTIFRSPKLMFMFSTESTVHNIIMSWSQLNLILEISLSTHPVYHTITTLYTPDK